MSGASGASTAAWHGHLSRLRAGALMGIATMVLASPALAQDDRLHGKQACAQAYTEAQTLRDEHKLVAAREKLRICTQSVCAPFIVRDCSIWMTDTEARIPRVVLTALDANGESLLDVAVTIDGSPLVSSVDGRAVDVDPGAHTFGFTRKDGTKVERQVLVREGNGAQEVSVRFEAAAEAPKVVPVVPALPPPHLDESPAVASNASEASSTFWTRRHVAGGILGGAGAAGIILGSVLGGLAISKSNAENAACRGPGNCVDHAAALNDHSSAELDGAVSTVGFIAGAVLAASGVALLATSSHTESGALRTLMITPRVEKDGLGLGVRASF